MKKRLMYAFLLAALVYIPASSKECGNACSKQVAIAPAFKTQLRLSSDTPAANESDADLFPVSPLSHLLITL